MTRARSALFVSLIALAFAPSSLLAQTRPTFPGKAWRVALAGDLDAMALAGELQTTLENARERKASLVLLEMGGNGYRTDVVWAMAQVIQQSETPVVAFLQDTRDHRVGAGQLMLATLCESSWIDPETRIVSTQDDNLSFLAPEETDWERVERELAGSIWLRLRERGGEPLLARPLVDQQDAFWQISGDLEPAQFGRGDSPPDGAEPIITIGEEGSFAITLDPEQAVQLKLVEAIESRPALVLRQAGASPISPRKVELAINLPRVHQNAWTLLEQLDALLVDLERLPTRTDPTGQRSRRDIEAQLRRGVLDYQQGTALLDELLAEYPEIPSMPPPTSHERDFASTRDALNKRYEKLKSR